jgi:hypothetical protein
MRKLLVISFFVSFFVLSFKISAQERLIWDYPTKPGTEEWKRLENNKAKVEVCQIPESVLQSISTNNLTVLCLQYPLLYDVFAFENINAGLNKLFSDFNGIREFAKRKDAINCLKEKYLAEFRIFPNILETGLLLDRGGSIMLISMLEYILSYSGFYIHSSIEEQKRVLETLLFGYKEKLKYSEYFKGIGFTTNLFARAHIIIKMDTTLTEKFEGRNKMVLFSGMANAELINTIDSLSYHLIK